jgi:2-keto-4-pentenoate hydratase
VDLIASNVAAAKYIVGEFASPREREPNATDVRLVCNDKEMFTGKGTDSLGDQWRAALFVVNTMVQQGWRIEPGQVLLTGSLGRMLPGTTGHCVASYHSAETQWASLEINVTE